MLHKKILEQRDGRLEQVSQMLGERFDPANGEEIKDFVAQFYARVPPEDVCADLPENLYGAALSLWKFAAQRDAGQAKLRVYNPRTEEHGWKSHRTIVEIVTDDMPFLVDSVTANLNKWDCQVHLAIHPVVRLRRDDHGERQELLPPVANGKVGISEAVMHIQIAEQSDSATLETIATDLAGVLADVRVAVTDWPAMLAQLDDAIDGMDGQGAANLPQSTAEVEESRAFLAWMRDNHFTLLGCRDYGYGRDSDASSGDELSIVPGSSLGVFRDESRHVLTRPDGVGLIAAVLMAKGQRLPQHRHIHNHHLPDRRSTRKPVQFHLKRRGALKYFPRPLRRGHQPAILQHRLRREIIATVTANSIVNRLGITFVHDVMADTGATIEAVARSYAAVRDLFAMRELWSEIETLDNKVPTSVQTGMVLATAEFLRRMTIWFLQNVDQPLRINTTVTTYLPGVTALREQLDQVIGEHEQKKMAKGVAALFKQGVAEGLSRKVVGLEPLTAACDIVQVAADSGRPVEEVGRAHFALGARLGLDRLCAAAEAMEAEDHWQRQAVASIVEDLRGQQRALTAVVLRQANGAGGTEAVSAWCESNKPQIARSDDMIAEFEQGGMDIAKLALANRYMRRLIIG